MAILFISSRKRNAISLSSRFTVSYSEFTSYSRFRSIFYLPSDLAQFAYCYTENDAVVIKDELFGK